MRTLKSMKQPVLAAAILASLAGFPSAHAAPPLRDHPAITPRGLAAKAQPKAANKDYQIVQIALPPEAIGGVAYSINNRQTVAGVYTTTSGEDVTFVWDRGRFESIAYPGAPITSVPGISDSGNILFGNWGTAEVQHAAIYNRRTGAWTTLPAIEGKPVNLGLTVNNAGIGVGEACEGSYFGVFNCVFWTWDGAKYSFLPIPARESQQLFSINDRGQISGWYFDDSPVGFQSFIFNRGEILPLAVERPTNAFGINNQTQVLLITEVEGTPVFQPALYDGGVVTMLPVVPDSLQTVWFGINERGDLAGAMVEGFPFIPKAFVAFRK